MNGEANQAHEWPLRVWQVAGYAIKNIGSLH